MQNPSAEAAARNNAAWCNDVCLSHGLAAHMGASLWQCAPPVPRYYPNAVTLDPSAPTAQMAAIGALAAAHPAATLSVKDSFSALDLAPLGFGILFEATWISRAARNDAPAPRDVEWAVVRTPAQLLEWEAAWQGHADVPHGALFLPPLLENPDVFVLAAERTGRIVAGGIFNRSPTMEGPVVGLSNAFATTGEDEAARWRQLASLAAHLAPGCPVVGYEAGAALQWALDSGFSALQQLRIWVRNAES